MTVTFFDDHLRPLRLELSEIQSGLLPMHLIISNVYSRYRGSIESAPHHFPLKRIKEFPCTDMIPPGRAPI